MALTDIAATVQSQLSEATVSAQDAIVEAVRTWTTAVERVLPEDGRRRLADSLPRATEAIDRAFAAATEALQRQHDFAARLVSAAAPSDGATA